MIIKCNFIGSVSWCVEDGFAQRDGIEASRGNEMLTLDRYRPVLGSFDAECVAERVFRENISSQESRIVSRRQNGNSKDMIIVTMS